VVKLSGKQKEQLILHLIKSCENFNLNEKESIGSLNKVLDKNISRRTYYNYKKRLYDKDIFIKLKDTMYDTKSLSQNYLSVNYNTT